MVAQNVLRTVDKKQVFFNLTAVLHECLQQIPIPTSIHTCTELPTNISTMTSEGLAGPNTKSSNIPSVPTA